MRHTGPALSAFNAWVLTKGLETMNLRVTQSCNSALVLGEFLERQPQISRVLYPHLPSHPQYELQYELAKKQMKAGGTVLTFELAPPAAGTTKDAAFSLLNALRIIDISNNLGDTKSLITHPATTTHRAMGPGGRAAIGLSDGFLRLSVGLEDVDDLQADLARALAAV
jgi:O-succinylhomoserine sulfhydrylase